MRNFRLQPTAAHPAARYVATKMRIKHPAITSPVFKLIRTLEFDLTRGDEMWPTRVELYQSLEKPKVFRCRLWQAENYR